tara:strand:- start:16053 stop:16568 length:516 start_codon:yes stop_codon:yes gene_type:complete
VGCAKGEAGAASGDAGAFKGDACAFCKPDVALIAFPVALNGDGGERVTAGAAGVWRFKFTPGAAYGAARGLTRGITGFRRAPIPQHPPCGDGDPGDGAQSSVTCVTLCALCDDDCEKTETDRLMGCTDVVRLGARLATGDENEETAPVVVGTSLLSLCPGKLCTRSSPGQK